MKPVVADEARRLAIAGSQLAKGDFRLQKLVPPLQSAGMKAPVFAKVAECAEAVIAASEKESATALLELSTLVGAVLYTQGTTGAEGKIEDLKNKDLGIHSTKATARVLAPLIEALTTTGSGRLETIRDAHQRGAFKDLRLVEPTLRALDDVYSEIGDLVANEILPIYGSGIYTAVREDFDQKGKGGHARRLRLLHKIDPAATRDIVLEAFENGSKEVKIAAIACLGSSKDDLPILKEQASAKSKELRAAAYEALAAMGTPDGIEIIQQALAGKDIDQAIHAVRCHPSPEINTFLIDESSTRLDAFLAGTIAKSEADPELHRLRSFLRCLHGSSDSKVVKLLTKVVNHGKELEASLKKMGMSPVEAQGLVVVSIYALLYTGDPASRKLLADLALAPDCIAFEGLDACVAAVFLTTKPKDAFKKLSGWLVSSDQRKGRANKAESNRQEKSSALEGFIHSVCRHHVYFGCHLAASNEELRNLEVDSGWLEIATSHHNDDLVVSLAKYLGKTQETTKALLEAFDRASDEHGQAQVIEAMFAIQMPESTDKLIEAIKEHAGKTKAKRGYSYYLLRLVGSVPETEKKKIEELIPTLPEDIADMTTRYLV